ncbi:MAG: in like serine protease [Bacillales bacterium]|jgi:uncharacterized repeat protein (TIGR02543 family)|nr:in like serine protease [Bacillales bacterium]
MKIFKLFKWICLLTIIFSTVVPPFSQPPLHAETIKLSTVKNRILNEFKEISKINNSLEQNYAKNFVNVSFKDNISDEQIKTFAAKFDLINGKKISNNGCIYNFELSNQIISSLLLESMNYSSIVNFVEPEYRLKENVEPYYTNLWGLTNRNNPTYDINIEEAWSKTKGSNQVIVAVIDSGVDWNHPDLSTNIWKNTDEIANDWIDNDANGYVDDVRGWDFYNFDNNPLDDSDHGTHVSGTIAALENNSGIIGVSPGVKIMPLKILNSSGTGYVSDEVEAIEYAQENGATIVNMSLGSSVYSAAEYAAMSNASSLFFVTAAGNEETNNDYLPTYPASYNLPNKISVASLDSDGSLSYFSNYGASSVDVAAPGGQIYSTVRGSLYNYMSGTSMATPHVAGVAALLKSYRSNITPTQIKSIIKGSVTKIPSLQSYINSGGIVNAGAALNNSAIVPVTSVTLSPTSKVATVGTSFQLTATVNPSNASNKLVLWSSSNTSVATVSSSGLVSAIGNGTATITVKTNDGNKLATCLVTVTVPPDDSGDDFSNAKQFGVIRPGLNSLHGNLEVADDIDMFKITAPTSGYFTIYSSNTTTDIKAWFYNSNQELIDLDANAGEGSNFNLSVNLSEGQDYYLKVSHYDQNGTGDYTVILDAPLDRSMNVTFNSSRGSNVNAQRVYYNQLLTTPANPQRINFVFDGWYREPDYINKWNFSTDRVESNLTLYAKWNANLSTPTGLRISSSSKDSLTLNWNKVSGATGYEVYSSTSQSGPFVLNTTTSNTTNVNIYGVNINTTYYFKIRTFLNDGTNKYYSNYSPVVSGKPSLAAPTNVTTALSAYNAIKISWNKVVGASGYEIYRNTKSTGTFTLVGSTTTVNSFNNTNLATNTDYYYKIRAYTYVNSVKDYGNFSNVIKRKTMLIPSVPTSVKAESISFDRAKISWGAVSGASGYEVYISSSTGKYYKVATTSALNYISTGLKTNSTYFYKVRSYRVEDSIKVYSNYSVVVNVKPIPSAPTKTSGTHSAKNAIKVSWATVAGANGYEVYRSTKKTGAYSKIAVTTKNSYNNSALAKNKTYYYKVRAYRNVGKTKVFGTFSTIVSVRTLYAPSAPTSVVASSVSGSDIKVSWSAKSDVAGYQVYRSTTKTGTYSLILTTTNTSIKSSGLKVNTTYYYKVRAYTAGGAYKEYGKYSAVVSAKTIPRAPSFSAIPPYNTIYPAYVVGFSLNNYGSKPLRIYSKNAFLEDDDYYTYDRNLVLVNRNAIELSWIEIPAGGTGFIYFKVRGNPTWYDADSNIYFEFTYDGVRYRSNASYNNDRTYWKL